MGIKLANNCTTTLNGVVAVAATTIVVVSSIAMPALGPSDWTYLTLISISGGIDQWGNPNVFEIVKATGPLTPGADTTINVVRAQDGTNALPFQPGDICDLRVCRAAILDAAGGGGGSGTVTNVSASSSDGSLTPNVTNPTTTPNIDFVMPAVVAPGSATFANLALDSKGRVVAYASGPDFVGDSGAGGVRGIVPAPAAGDAAAGKFLSAGGGWNVPGGGAFVKIAQVVTSGSQTSVTFSSIPGTYTDLYITFMCRDNTTSANNNSVMQVNGDTASANYQQQVQIGNSNGTVLLNAPTGAVNGICLFQSPGTFGTSNPLTVGSILIPCYAQTTFQKYAICTSTAHLDGNSGFTSTRAGFWIHVGNPAITSLTFPASTLSYTNGSTFTLYGLG